MALCTKRTLLLLFVAYANPIQSLRSTSMGSKTSVVRSQIKNTALFDCHNDTEIESEASRAEAQAKCPRLGAYEPSGFNIRMHIDSNDTFDNRPLQWLHVPKTGSTFANSVVRMACSSHHSSDKGSTLPAYAAIRTHLPPRQDDGLMAYFSHCFPAAMRQCWGRPTAPSSATSREKRKTSSGVAAGANGERSAPAVTYRLHRASDPHESLINFQPARVAYVTMLREPLQRIASAYAHHHKGVGESCTRRGHDCHSGLTLLEYAQRPEVRGLYARMLTGLPWDQPPPWATDTTTPASASAKENAAAMQAAAVARLEAFAFVGLVEQWDLSVCVFHAAFATRAPTTSQSMLWPHRLEFSNLRPGSWSRVNAAPPDGRGGMAAAAKAAAFASGGPPALSGTAPAARAHVYDVKELRASLKAAGQLDAVDEVIYAAAVKRFEDQAAAYREGRVVPTQMPTPKLSGAVALLDRNFNANNPAASDVRGDEARFEFEPSTNVPRVADKDSFRSGNAAKSLFSGGFLPWLLLSAICFCAWVGFG